MAIDLLVVDSDRAFGELIRQTLEATGLYRVHAATSGAEGLSLAKKHPLQLAIIEAARLDMPPEKWLRAAREANPRMAVFAIPPATGSLELGGLEVDGVFPKPFYLPDLPRLVSEAVGLPPEAARPLPFGPPQPSSERQAEPEPEWLSDPSRAQETLTLAALPTPAKAAALIRNDRLWALTIPADSGLKRNQLAPLISTASDVHSRGSLTRFYRPPGQKEDFVAYVTPVSRELALVALFGRETPLGSARRSGENLVYALRHPTELPPVLPQLSPVKAESGWTPEEASLMASVVDLAESSPAPGSIPTAPLAASQPPAPERPTPAMFINVERPSLGRSIVPPSSPPPEAAPLDSIDQGASFGAARPPPVQSPAAPRAPEPAPSPPPAVQIPSVPRAPEPEPTPPAAVPISAAPRAPEPAPTSPPAVPISAAPRAPEPAPTSPPAVPISAAPRAPGPAAAAPPAVPISAAPRNPEPAPTSPPAGQVSPVLREPKLEPRLMEKAPVAEALTPAAKPAVEFDRIRLPQDWVPARARLPVSGGWLDPSAAAPDPSVPTGPAVVVPDDWVPSRPSLPGVESLLGDDSGSEEPPPIHVPEDWVPSSPMDASRLPFLEAKAPEPPPPPPAPEPPPAPIRLPISTVLIPRFPEHLLTRDVSERLRGWITRLCVAWDWKPERIDIQPDRLQVTLILPADESPAHAVQELRDGLSERVLRAFPELLPDLPSHRFWASATLLQGGPAPTGGEVESFVRETRRGQAGPISL
jgi:CheY-like chemotaxis protein